MYLLSLHYTVVISNKATSQSDKTYVIATYLSSFTTDEQSTCFLIKRGTRMPRWQSVVLPFKRDTWFAVLGVAILVGPLLFALSRSLVTRCAHEASVTMIDISKFDYKNITGAAQCNV